MTSKNNSKFTFQNMHRMRWALSASIACFALAYLFYGEVIQVHSRFLELLTCGALLTTGTTSLIYSLLLFYSAYWGKHCLIERLLDELDLHGNEQVLDVGCSRGELTISLARRLSSPGKVTGVDIWLDREEENSAEQETLHNAEVEGVKDLLSVSTADARQLPFEDSSFDVVTSCLTLHNLNYSEERLLALQEMLRVLRPGGKLRILDRQFTEEYAHYLRELGMKSVKLSDLQLSMTPFVRIVSASKRV